MYLKRIKRDEGMHCDESPYVQPALNSVLAYQGKVLLG